MFSIFKRTIRTRSGKVYQGELDDFIEGERYVERKHWLLPWKKERIYFSEIESDRCDLNGMATLIIILFTIPMLVFVMSIIFDGEGWPFNTPTYAHRTTHSQCKETLKRGSRGNEVKELQKYLSKEKFYHSKIDGIFGKKTKEAVIRFQQNNHLPVTGIIDKKTCQAVWHTL